QVLDICSVMPALVAGIHVFLSFDSKEGVDGRDKPGHDVESTLVTNKVHYCDGSSTCSSQSHMAAQQIVWLSIWNCWYPPSPRVKSRIVLRLEPTASKHFLASANGICSSPSPCSMRNGQAIFCTTPSSLNGSSRLRASACEVAFTTHRM